MAKADVSGRPDWIRLETPSWHGFFTATACAVSVVFVLAGCARPTGDFGRARSSTIHDDLLPALGSHAANQRGEPVSDFNLTNDERELRNRSWAIVSPPHSNDWYAAHQAEGQRTRNLGDVDRNLDPGKYYELLRGDRYQSSDARYDRVINDLQSDMGLVEPFFLVLRRVLDADAERLRAARASLTATDEERESARARVGENIKLQNWVCRALRFRLKAYRIAINRLKIETPSDRLFEANIAWRRLDEAVNRAQAVTARSLLAVESKERPSRYSRQQWAKDDKVPQK